MSEEMAAAIETPVESSNPAGEAALNSVDSTETLAAKNAIAEAEEALSGESEESNEESQEASAEETKEEIEELKKELKKFKLKVDGEEFEEEVDLGDEEYLTRQLQLAKVAQKRMQNYSQLEKEVSDFIQLLKEDPARVLSDPNIGIDIKQFAAQIIEQEIENSKKSPEQLEKEKLENELKSLKEEREREKQELQQKEFERLQAQEAERYDTMITKALDNSDLPKSPYVVKKIADYMYMGLQENIELTAEDVLPLVRDEIQKDIKDMFSVMPDEVIEAMVGKDVISRIRKSKVAAAKKAPPTPLKKAVADTATKLETEDEKSEKVKMSDFFSKI